MPATTPPQPHSVHSTPRPWKCWLGLFVLCWAAERWKAITAHLESPDSAPTASETFRTQHARIRFDL